VRCSGSMIAQQVMAASRGWHTEQTACMTAASCGLGCAATLWGGTFFLTSIKPSRRSNSFLMRAFSASSSCRRRVKGMRVLVFTKDQKSREVESRSPS
jgi:hypothetical protein